MKEIPMLFSTPMVIALLNRSKTQTRRVVNPTPSETGIAAFNDGAHPLMKCPYGQPGDLIWVRETFAPEDDNSVDYFYKANNRLIKEPKWRPSLFMPKAAARIWLQVTEINVQRLQEIKGEDAIAEGVKTSIGLSKLPKQIQAIAEFRKLWISLNGEQSWDENPWVWVVKFKVVSTTGREAVGC